MKKRFVCMICLICLLVPVCAQASLAKKLESVRNRTYLEKAPAKHNFWFDGEDNGYAQWERVSGGVNFRIKVHNHFPYDNVDAYTFEISAKNVYEEPIQLKSSDGTYCSSLQFSGEKTFQPGKNGYTEYFKLRSNEKIRYVYVKLIKYHTDEGTIYLSEDEQTEYWWKIN